ncbi:cathepsin [Acrasis kona]|uniref:Cathepsin n=1 Tax=Acrasis kona TaxID=1008807 RepID=A0AAW2Z364_9EUKA
MKPVRPGNIRNGSTTSRKVGNIVSIFEKKKEDEHINSMIIEKLKSDAMERRRLGIATPRVDPNISSPQSPQIELKPDNDDSVLNRVQDIRKRFEQYQKKHDVQVRPNERRKVSPDENNRSHNDEVTSVTTMSTTTSSGSTEKRMDEEETEFDQELFNHWYDNIMSYPPPTLIKGLFGEETKSTEEEFDADVRIRSPSSTKKFKVGELDLLSAYKHKSLLYTQNHPFEVRVNPFIFNSNVRLNTHGDQDELPHWEADDSYGSDEEAFDYADEHDKELLQAHITGNSFADDDSFVRWEMEMERKLQCKSI